MSWESLQDNQKREFLNKEKLSLVSTKVSSVNIGWFLTNRGKITVERVTSILENVTDKDIMFLCYYLGACPLTCVHNIIDNKNINVKEKVAKLRRILRTFEDIVDKRLCFLAIFKTPDVSLFNEMMTRLVVPYNLIDNLTVECIKNRYPLHCIRYLSDRGANPNRVRQLIEVSSEIDLQLCPAMDTSED